jgi:hypothetical protein
MMQQDTLDIFLENANLPQEDTEYTGCGQCPQELCVLCGELAQPCSNICKPCSSHHH